MTKEYEVREKIDSETEKELGDYDNLTAQLLWNRGIKTKKEAIDFLNPNFETHLHDPFLLPDMQKAVDRILKAIDGGERIGIWSDYDADGIPGGALLHDFFKLIGFENFTNYIPDRHSEGYGLNKGGVEELAKDGVKLLITIDCGIRDHEQIEMANKLGMDVIVTDHHEPAFAKSSGVAKPTQEEDDLPPAYAIVNPKRTDSKYPEKILCGSGVIWKLIEAILITLRSGAPTHFPDITSGLRSGQIQVPKPGFEKWLLDLVGIATLSDMVPLIGENRVLAHFGLTVLRKNRRAGLRKLFGLLKINKDFLNEDDIGFLITPRINAASRMGKPRDAFELLVAETETEADLVAKHLDKINNERKGLVASIVKEAKKRVKEKFENEGEKNVIVLGNPDWRPALLGLAANSIAEEYNRPVFLWGREGGEFIKGSCRSDGVTNLVSIMESAREIFLEFGGHKMSGGFSVDHQKIHFLEETLIEASTHTLKIDETILADAEINLKMINEKTITQINKLAPFGVGNEKPIFIFREVIPEKINRFGKTKEHLSVNFREGTETKKGIAFFTSPDQFGDKLKEGIKTNLVANIEKSFYNGRTEIRLRIVDFF
jgi:single-stranded-DNA-specific exonuclease